MLGRGLHHVGAPLPQGRQQAGHARGSAPVAPGAIDIHIDMGIHIDTTFGIDTDIDIGVRHKHGKRWVGQNRPKIIAGRTQICRKKEGIFRQWSLVAAEKAGRVRPKSTESGVHVIGVLVACDSCTSFAEDAEDAATVSRLRKKTIPAGRKERCLRL